jgi:hypothetical protein
MQSKVFRSALTPFIPAATVTIAVLLVLQGLGNAAFAADAAQPRAGVPQKRVVINFTELARRQAAEPDTNRTGRVIHAPLPKSQPWTNTLSTVSSSLQKDGSPILGSPLGPLGPLGPASPPPEEGGSFPAIIDDERFIPPDTMGAVGPDHVMTTLNSEVQIQSRQGDVISKVALETFWNSLGHTIVFDPKVYYDHFHRRWLFITMADAELPSSALMIGVSNDSDPTGNWTLFDVDADAGNTLWADYPNVGFSEKWVVVTANMFTVANDGFTRSDIYAFDQQNLNASGAFKTFSDLGFTYVPAVNYDAGQASLYLLTQEDDGLSLRIASISGQVGQEMFTVNVALAATTQGWQFVPPAGPNFLPQLGSTVLIAANDSRLMNCVLRNGSLWCTHHVFLPANGIVDRAAVQWWQIQPTGAVVQRGRIEDPSAKLHYVFPSIAVNVNSDVLIGYSRFSSDRFASGGYTYHFATDSPGVTGQDTVLKAGEAPYAKDFGGGRVRWGDYSATVVDPLNDVDMWTIQEYAATPGSRGDRWGTWWGQLLFGGAPDGILEINVNPPSDSVLLAGSTENIFARVTDGIAVTNAAIAVTASVGSAPTFHNDGVAPDQTANDAVYSTAFRVPTNASSVTLTLVFSAPGKDRATNTLNYSIVPPPPNDNFTNAIKVPPGGTNYISNNRFATIEPGEPAHAGVATFGASLWWSWTPNATTNTLLDTTGSGFDTVVAVYTGNTLTGLTPVVSADNVGTRRQAYLNFTATNGATYRIAVAAANTNNVGSLFFRVAPGGQADTNAPIVAITSPPSGLFTSTNRITVAGAAVDQGQTPSGINQIFIRVNTRTAASEEDDDEEGEDEFIYTVLDSSSGAPVSTNWSRVVALKEGQNTIEVTASDIAGNLSDPAEITVVYRLRDPINDLFANPIELAPNSGSSSVTNANATKEFGEPNHAGNAGGKSVWWSFQAPSDGVLFLTTSNSTFDTVMGLYQGTRVTSLTTVASNDDAFEGVLFSKISQAIRGNEIYRIAVDGFGGSTGVVALAFSFTANPVNLLTVNATPGGAVNPGTGYYANGSTVVFTATADPNFEFVDWEGGVTSSANPLSVLVSGDITLTARFRARAFSDGFESGGFTALPWSHLSDTPWLVQSNTVALGQYAARSGAIANNESSSLVLSINTSSGFASFDYKVSSETNWDWLEFYINDVLQQRWSGEVGWATYAFAVPAGPNSLLWRYVKDSVATTGLDAAFIDNLDLPLATSSLRLVGATAGDFRIQLLGSAPQTVRILGSTDLSSWQTLFTTNVAAGAIIQFSDPQRPTLPFRFYRAVSP